MSLLNGLSNCFDGGIWSFDLSFFFEANSFAVNPLVPKFSRFSASRKDTERMQLFNDGEAISHNSLIYFEFPHTSIVAKSSQKKRKKLFQSIAGYDRYFVGGLI